MLPLLFFAFTLTVLPLVSVRVAAALLVLNYLLQTKGIKGINFSRRALTFSILATIALIVASFTAQNLPIPITLLQWLIFIWSVPLFGMLIGKYGQQKIIAVTLIVICFHAVWGISQFIRQRDLGLIAIGESNINIYEPAIAKVNLPYAPFKLLRAYGPYKHANSFAGVLVLGLTLVFSPLRRGRSRGGEKELDELIIFFFLTLALATTFSRAAIFSFLLFLIIYAKIFSRRKYFLILFILVLTFMPLMVWRFSFTGAKDKAVPERINSFQWANEIIKENNFWPGVGLGHYPAVLKNYLDNHSINYQPWQIDFVHSVPLQLLAEWGIAPILFLFLGLLITNYGLRLPQVAGYWLLVTLSPILLTDHYFVTQLAPGFFLLLIFNLQAAVSSGALPYAATAPATPALPKPPSPPTG